MHVVVIGGGIIGLTTAYHLVREGASVTLVDARATGLGASDVNAGMLVPADIAPTPGPGMITQGLKMMLHSDSPLYIRPSLKPSFLSFMLGMARACNDKAQRAGYAANLLLMSDSLQWFDEYKSDGMEFELDDTGLLIAFQSKANVEGHLSHVDMFEFCGIEPVRLVGDEVQEHEPLLADSVEAALFFPKERAIDPGALVTALHQRLVELGVEIVENSPIERVEMNGGRVRSVRSANQVFSGDEYVLAAGAWTGQVSKKFGYHLPIRAGKGYCIDVEPFGLKGPVLPAEAKAAVTPMKDRLRLAGTMEFAGLDENINQVRVDAIIRSAGEYFRNWEPPHGPVQPKAGMRPMAPDGLPIIGRLGQLKNVTVSTGHAMSGMTLGPASAALVTELVLHDHFAPQLAPYSPARFRGGR